MGADFQIRAAAAATGKARLPTVVSLTGGTAVKLRGNARNAIPGRHKLTKNVPGPHRTEIIGAFRRAVVMVVIV